jgi:hypothetical protein
MFSFHSPLFSLVSLCSYASLLSRALYKQSQSTDKPSAIAAFASACLPSFLSFFLPSRFSSGAMEWVIENTKYVVHKPDQHREDFRRMREEHDARREFMERKREEVADKKEAEAIAVAAAKAKKEKGWF